MMPFGDNFRINSNFSVDEDFQLEDFLNETVQQPPANTISNNPFATPNNRQSQATVSSRTLFEETFMPNTRPRTPATTLTELEFMSARNRRSNLNDLSERFSILDKNMETFFNEDELIEDEQRSMADDQPENDVYLCVLHQSGTLAFSCYDAAKKCLYNLKDMEDSNGRFELIDTIIDDVQPRVIITSLKSDQRFVHHLKVSARRAEEENDDSTMLTRDDSFELIVLPNGHFTYEQAKERIFGIETLANMPKTLNMTGGEKIIFYSCLFDFEAKCMIRCVGALLEYLNKNRINLEFGINTYETAVLTVRPYSLDKMLFLDANTYKSLQIFSDVDYHCAKKLTYSDAEHFRTTLSDKQNTAGRSLYAYFVSKLSTKIGVSKLRSYMLKPTRDATVLGERLALVDFFTDYRNQSLVKFLQKTLHSCKYIQSILKRMKIAKCSLNEWKRVYKTTQSFMKIIQLSKLIGDKLNSQRTRPNMSNASFTFSTIHEVSSSTISGGGRTTESVSSAGGLIGRCCESDQEVKFEYLTELFDRIVNIKESNEKRKLKINANVSKVLDDKRTLFAMLPEYLSKLAEKETNKYGLAACQMVYLSMLGFLLKVKLTDMINVEDVTMQTADETSNMSLVDESTSTSANQSMYSTDRMDAERENVEKRNQFIFVFKADEYYYYKTNSCRVLDEEIGDIALQINDLESEIVDKLQSKYVKYSHVFAEMIDYCAELDCLLAFATAAFENNYVKPHLTFDAGSYLDAKAVRHPLVELDATTPFVPNHVKSGRMSRIKLITGPNACGKTVYLKQVALLVYMSMLGGYVAASEAHVGDFDRILTRLTTNECVSLQLSSFSIDLRQIADAINSATQKSLLIVDEFGRGTELADGQAFLAATIKYFLRQSSASPHVYLATHFYEMLHNGETLFKENNAKIDYLTFDYIVSERLTLNEPEQSDEYNLGRLTLLYSLKPGIAKSSYAFNIAANVQLPDGILQRVVDVYKLIMDNIYNTTDDSDASSANEPAGKKAASKLEKLTKHSVEFSKYRDKVSASLKLNYENNNLSQENSLQPSEHIAKKAQIWRSFLREKFPIVQSSPSSSTATESTSHSN